MAVIVHLALDCRIEHTFLLQRERCEYCLHVDGRSLDRVVDELATVCIGGGGQDSLHRPREPATSVANHPAHDGAVADRQPHHMGTNIVSHVHFTSARISSRGKSIVILISQMSSGMCR